MVYGIYDIIAKVEANNIETLKDVTTEKTRTLDKVRSTLTMIAIE